jgi:alpha-beta hydrolase superfamily lysophospholipase
VISQLAALNLQVVCLIGHSMGGNIVLLHSAQHSTIPLVINLSARFDLERGTLQPTKPADKISFEQNGEFEIKRKGKSFVIRKEVFFFNQCC